MKYTHLGLIASVAIAIGIVGVNFADESIVFYKAAPTASESAFVMMDRFRQLFRN